MRAEPHWKKADTSHCQSVPGLKALFSQRRVSYDETVTRLPVTILRGGTSKGVYILETDLPADKAEWEPLLLRLMGSPDKKQIDGLGGSQSVTSKVAIVKKSDRPDADVDYTFA